MEEKTAQRGAAAVMVAFVLPVIIGTLALGFDYGFAQQLHRSLQDAADAAALSAAYEYRGDPNADYEAAALYDAGLNGFTTADSTINVYRPPQAGPKAGDNNYVEVVIARIQPQYFMGMLGAEPKLLQARSVAGLEADNTCVYVLDESASSAFEMDGNSDFEARNCRVHVNSTHSNALNVSGNASLTASSVGVVGGYTGSNITPVPEIDLDPIGDPLASLPAPTAGPCDRVGRYEPVGAAILTPGTYCGGIKLNNNVSATFMPGTYIIYGGTLEITAQAEANGSNVMFYFTQGPGYPFTTWLISGGTNTTLSAPAAGAYKGILFFQDRNIVSTDYHRINGSAGMNLTGTMYMPTGMLHVSGNADVPAQDVMMVVKKIRFSGSGNMVTQIDTATDIFSPYVAQAYVVE